MFNNELKNACQAAAVELANRAEEQASDLKDYEPSAEFESAMQKIIENEREGRYRCCRRRKCIRVAVVAAIIAVVLAVTCIAVRLNDDPEKKYLLTVYDKWTSVEHLDVKTPLYYSFMDYDFTPGYIPEGFELYEEQDDDTSYVYIYRNENGRKLIIRKRAAGGISNINTEFYPYEEVVIDDTWVIIFRCIDCGTDSYCCIFFRDALEYTVTGAETRDDLIKIIENME